MPHMSGLKGARDVHVPPSRELYLPPRAVDLGLVSLADVVLIVCQTYTMACVPHAQLQQAHAPLQPVFFFFFLVLFKFLQMLKIGVYLVFLCSLYFVLFRKKKSLGPVERFIEWKSLGRY